MQLNKKEKLHKFKQFLHKNKKNGITILYYH